MPFNRYQLAAINAKLGHNVLISAGAGSGKTKTLSYKVYKLVKEDGVDPASLLVLTFTNKAAFEMKERIIKEFKNDKTYADKIASAHIQTFDSFSLYLAKKYSARLGLPDSITVMEESILESKKKEYLDEVLDELYKTDFDRVVTSFRKFNLKQDDKSKAMILSIDEELNKMMDSSRKEFIDNYDRNHLDHDGFMNELDVFFKCIKSQMEDEMRYQYFNFLTEGVEPQRWPNVLKKAADWNMGDPLPLKYGNNKKFYDLLLEIYNADCDSFLTKALEVNENKKIVNGTWNKRSTILKEGTPEDCVIYKGMQETLKIPVALAKEYGTDLEKQYQTILSFQDDIHLMFEIIERMNKKLTEYKETVNAYTFSEIGSKALMLLTDEQYADIAEEIKDRFRYVLVDEYQDTNDVQETFLNQISEKATLFCVGDAKQSIYGFRNSNVQLFLDRRDAYEKDPSKGEVINMNWNYRSDTEVLLAINAIFLDYMTQNHGGIVFSDEKEQLDHDPDFHRAHVDGNEYGTYWIRTSPDDKYKKMEYEAKAIITDIESKIRSHYQVIDGETFKPRDCRYSDFAILIRKKRSFQDYEEMFKEAGIPFNDEVDDVLSQVNAVMTLQSLIRLIADDLRILNKEPHQENRLHLYLSLARSYLYGNKNGYTDDVIYRSINSEEGFEKDPIMTSVFDFAKQHKDSPLSLLFSDLLAHFKVISSLPHVGEVDVNISKIESFYQLILSQERQGQNIFDFVNIINNLSKYSVELKANTVNERENAVRLMTIHKSKGLEFPIVYLPFTDNCLSGEDNRTKPLSVFSKDYGILLPNYKENEKVKTIFHSLYKEGEGSNQAEIDEQVRVNYVALTRAKEAIYFVGQEEEKDKGNESLYWMLKSGSYYPILNPDFVSIYVEKKKIGVDEYEGYLKLREAYGMFDSYKIPLDTPPKEKKRILLLIRKGKEKIIAMMNEQLKATMTAVYHSFVLKIKSLSDDNLVLLFASVHGYKAMSFADLLLEAQNRQEEQLEELKHELEDARKRREKARAKDDKDSWDEYIEELVAEIEATEPITEESLWKDIRQLPLDFIEKDEKGDWSEHDLLSLCKFFDQASLNFGTGTYFCNSHLKTREFTMEQYETMFGKKEEKNVVLPEFNKDENGNVKEVKEIEFLVYGKKKRASMDSEINEDEDLNMMKNAEYGTYLHRLLELTDFSTKETSFIEDAKAKSIIDKVLALPLFDNITDAKVYHEYNYYDDQFQNEGSIDCLIVRKDSVDIIDYKTSDIDKSEYITQLSVYARNIRRLFPGVPVHCYLLSLLKQKVREVLKD